LRMVNEKFIETKRDSLLTVLDCKLGEENSFSRQIVRKPYKQQKVPEYRKVYKKRQCVYTTAL